MVNDNPMSPSKDISMQWQSGLETISRIKQFDLSAKTLVFSMYQNPSFAVQAIRADALTYVTKSSVPEVLIRVIINGTKNKHYLSADIDKL